MCMSVCMCVCVHVYECVYCAFSSMCAHVESVLVDRCCSPYLLGSSHNPPTIPSSHTHSPANPHTQVQGSIWTNFSTNGGHACARAVTCSSTQPWPMLWRGNGSSECVPVTIDLDRRVGVRRGWGSWGQDLWIWVFWNLTKCFKIRFLSFKSARTRPANTKNLFLRNFHDQSFENDRYPGYNMIYMNLSRVVIPPCNAVCSTPLTPKYQYRK